MLWLLLVLAVPALRTPKLRLDHPRALAHHGARHAAHHATHKSDEDEEADEGADEEAEGADEAEAELLHNSKAQTDMLRSLLLANSQMMYAINTLEKESVKMRESLSAHEEKLAQCERELSEMTSAQQQADADRVTLDEPSSDSSSFTSPTQMLQVAAEGRKAAEAALAAR